MGLVVRNLDVNVGVGPRTDGPSDIVVGMEIDNNLKANGFVKAYSENPCILVRSKVFRIFMELRSPVNR